MKYFLIVACLLMLNVAHADEQPSSYTLEVRLIQEGKPEQKWTNEAFYNVEVPFSDTKKYSNSHNVQEQNKMAIITPEWQEEGVKFYITARQLPTNALSVTVRAAVLSNNKITGFSQKNIVERESTILLFEKKPFEFSFGPANKQGLPTCKAIITIK